MAEIELLHGCLSSHLRSAKIEKIQQLIATQTIDWTALTTIAIAHGTLPLLYKNLVEAWPAEIDVQVLKPLKTYCRFNTFRNFQLTQELQNLIALFEENKIRAIAFKGPSLAALAYGDISLRQFSDLDILIHPQDFLAARDLLLNDYMRTTPLAFASDADKQDLSVAIAQGEYSFQNKTAAIAIDLHCRLMTGEIPAFAADFSLLQRDLAPVLLLGQPILTLNPENMLIYLCAHGAKDFWKKLGWVCDVAALIETFPQLDWALIVAQAKALKCEKTLCLGLVLARDIVEISLPESIDKYVTDTFTKSQIASKIQTRLLSGVLPGKSQHFYLQRFYFYGALKPTRLDQLRFYGRYALPFLRRWLR